MKNIYEDGTLPGNGDIPQIKRPTPSAPTRPRKQVTPTPMQQEQLQNQQAQIPPAPYGTMPAYGAPVYPYVPVGTDANGQPVYAPQAPMSYPQPVPVYPYAPYIPVAPQPSQVPVQHTEFTTEQNPGTRVLYQSPDFDMNDPTSAKNTEVGASFAGSALRNEPISPQEEIAVEVEELSLTQNSKGRISGISVEENIEVDEVDFDEVQFRALLKEKTPTEPVKQTAAEGSDNKKAKLPKSEIIRRTVLSVSIVAIIVAGGMLINEFRLAQQNENVEEDVSNLIIEEPTTKKKNNKEEKEETTEPQLTPEQQWAKIKQEYPNVIFPANIQLKYAKLYAENTDFVGYLSADAVKLNLPVVQAQDDEEYLKKNFYGQTTKYGCPFVTHLNNIDPLDMNTVIFGHHMNNNTIFGTLDAYKKIDGFKKAPVITFNTLYRDYQWKIIAAFITNAYGKDDLNNYVFPYYFTRLSTYDRFSAYLNELSQRSLYDTGVDVVATDKILTLSTCSHEFEDARFVVVARLVRPGESAGVDTSKAVVNSNPRYPQAYYTAKKIKSNPYKNATQWQVG